ncbi:MAG: cyclic nucleotide-binding domain-containing protein [Synechococcus sp.]
MDFKELALRSGSVLDVPPKVAQLLALAGVVGVILVVAGSLVGDRPETLEVDKVIHFMAYGTLAAVFVLSLKLRWCLYPLIWLALLSYAIELLQPLNMRSFDIGDAIANTLGILVGAGVGLAARLGYGYVKTELETARIRRSLKSFPPGSVLLQEGQVIDRLYVIHSGTVILTQSQQDGNSVEIARLGVGSMFGLLPEILKIPQPATVTAETTVQVYPIDYDALIDDIGGSQQPLGIIVTQMANELRRMGQSIATLKGK